MKVFIALLVLVALAAAKTNWSELEGYTFEDYKEEFQKEYSCPMEHQLRKMIFEQKLKEIKAHNEDKTQSYKKGINHMSDWTQEEFRAIRGYKKSLAYASPNRVQSSPSPANFDYSALPVNVDWRTKNIITAVKDQGACGSCWTFGTTEGIESYWALKTGNLIVGSEQQILDCTPNPNQCGGTGGCGGGTPELAYAQIMKNGGLETEAAYPYTAEAGTCQFNGTSVSPFAIVKNFTVLPSNKLLPVMTHLANNGPLVVNVDASAWQDYDSGVFTGCNNANPDIDHVVQLVGYGTDPSNGDFWLVRNSWNAGWGEEGYIRLQRVGDGTCGTDTNPSDGTGCQGGPAQVTVCGSCGILYDVSFPVV